MDRPQRDADCSSKGDWKGMENVSVQDIVLATGGVLLSGDDGVMLNKIRLDSRQVETGDLFVPIIGEKVDAHKFLEQVAEKGAGAVLTSEHKEKTEEMAEFFSKGNEGQKKEIQHDIEQFIEQLRQNNIDI